RRRRARAARPPRRRRRRPLGHGRGDGVARHADRRGARPDAPAARRRDRALLLRGHARGPGRHRRAREPRRRLVHAPRRAGEATRYGRGADADAPAGHVSAGARRAARGGAGRGAARARGHRAAGHGAAGRGGTRVHVDGGGGAAMMLLLLLALLAAPAAAANDALGVERVEAITLAFAEPIDPADLARMVTIELRPLPGVGSGQARWMTAADFQVKALERHARSDPATYVLELASPVPL